MINAQISEANEILANKTAVSDGVKFEKIKFHFPESWNGLTKTAVFTYGEEAPINVVLNSNSDSTLGEDECYIPFEVLKTPSFKLSVFATKGDTTATATEAEITVKQSGYALGEEASAPTPSAYQQLVDIATDAKELAESVRKDADSGVFKGEKGDKGDTGPKGIKGDKGDKGETGQDYILTETDKNEIAEMTKPFVDEYLTTRIVEITAEEYEALEKDHDKYYFVY